MLLLAVIAAWEWWHMLRWQSFTLEVLFVAFILVGCYWGSLFAGPILMMAAFWWLLALGLLLRFKARQRVSHNGFILAMIGGLCLIPTVVSLVILRAESHGQWLILFLCALIWAADSGAYFVGKAVGRHKLIPSVSPGKNY